MTALALTVELGDWQRFRPQSLGPFLGLTPGEDSSGERRRQGAITKPATPMRAGRWSKPPGTSAGRCARAPRSSGVDRASRQQCARRQTRAHDASTPAGTRSRVAANGARSSRSRSRASWPATAGHSRQCSCHLPSGPPRRAHRRQTREKRPARQLRTAPVGRHSTLESGSTSHLAHPVMRSRPRISAVTQASTRPVRSPRQNKRPAYADPQDVRT